MEDFDEASLVSVLRGEKIQGDERSEEDLLSIVTGEGQESDEEKLLMRVRGGTVESAVTQDGNPAYLTSDYEASKKGDMGITETAQKDYEAATGIDAPENPILAQIANMGQTVGGKLNAGLQMEAAQKLAQGGNYSEDDIHDLMNQMTFGVVHKADKALRTVPSIAMPGMIAAPQGKEKTVNAIVDEWAKGEGSRYTDPEERRVAMNEFARQIGDAFVKERTATKQNAQTELNMRDATTAANIVSRGLAQVGYTLPYMLGPVGIALQFAEEGAANAQELKNNEYGYDDEGRFKIVAEGDSAGRAYLKGYRSAGKETAIEVVGGKVTTALGKAIGVKIGAHKLFEKVGEKVVATKVGKAAAAFAKPLGDMLRWMNRKMHIGNLAEENIEELEGNVISAFTGDDQRDSELKRDFELNGTTAGGRAWEAFKKFFEPEELLKLNEAMIITMGGTAALAHYQNRKAMKQLDNVIRKNELLSEKEIAEASLETKAQALDAWINEMSDKQIEQKLRDGADWTEKFANKIYFDKESAEEIKAFKKRMDERRDYNLGIDLKRLNIEPRQFEAPTVMGVDGKPKIDFRKTIVIDRDNGNKTMTVNMVRDEKSGVMITDNGTNDDSSYTVHSPDLKTTRDYATLREAVDGASDMINNIAKRAAEDKVKIGWIEKTVAENYQGANIVHFKTIEEAAAYSAANNYDITETEGYRPDVEAWRMPDGTIVLVRDNIKTPKRLMETLRHEIVGHSGETMSDKFLNTAAENKQVQAKLKGQSARGLSDKQALKEAVAVVIQERRHKASTGEKISAAIRSKAREIFNKNLSLSDAEIEVAAEKIEKEMREGKDGNLNAIPAQSANVDTIEDTEEEVEEPAAETKGAEAETKTPDLETKGAETETAEVKNETTAKPVNERNIVEKLTDQAKAEEIPLDEIEVSDSRLPQFKEGADPITGEVEPLTGEPYDLVSSPIVVMEFKDGKKVVVTGRHRYGLYKRSGRKTIAARVIKEADGWTVKDAMAIDAIGNIIDEKGTEKDYVKYFDEAKPTRAEAKDAGFLDRNKGRRAFGIYEGATADTKSVIDWEGTGGDGKISVDQAGIISEAAPKNENKRFGAVQRILVQKALQGLRGKKLGILARSLAEEVKNRKDTPKVGGEMQLDLFTSAEDQELLKLEDKRADYRVKKAEEYNRVAEVLRTAISKGGKLDLNEEYARELGITDAKDKKQLLAARDKAVERADYWENAIRLEDADKSQMDAEITAKAEKGKTKAAAALEKANKAVKEVKAKREGKKVEPKAEEPKQEAKVESKAEVKKEEPKVEPKKEDDTPPEPIIENGFEYTIKKDGAKGTPWAVYRDETKIGEVGEKGAAEYLRKKTINQDRKYSRRPTKKSEAVKKAEEAKAVTREDALNLLKDKFYQPLADLERELKETPKEGAKKRAALEIAIAEAKKRAEYNIDKDKQIKANTIAANLGIGVVAFGADGRIEADSRDVAEARIKGTSLPKATEATTEENSGVAPKKPAAKKSGVKKLKLDKAVEEEAKSALGNVDFMAPETNEEFDYEKFGNLVKGVGKVVAALEKGGYKDFGSLVRFIASEAPEKYEKAKAVLQDVWNALARQKKYSRVSDSEAERIYGIIDEEAKNGRTTSDNQRRDEGDGGSLGGALPANDTQAPNEETTRGEGVRSVEEGARTTDSGAGRGSGRDLGGDSGRRDNPGRGGNRRGGAGEGATNQDANRRTDRQTVPVQRGDVSGEQRAASDGVDAGTQGTEGGLDAGRPERGNSGRGSAGEPEGATPSVKRAATKAVEKSGPVITDFVMTPAVEEAIFEKNDLNRVRNNVAAIKLVNKLRADNAQATPDEQATLAKFVGWGGLSEILSRDYDKAEAFEKEGNLVRANQYINYTKYGKEGYELYKEIKTLLTPEELANARESTLTAFYTPIQMVRLQHEALRKLGVMGGRFLGPSAGVGNYASAAGEYKKGANWQFVEKDRITGEILKQLFPNQKVHIGGFEETKFADSFFDFAIDNVPYGDINLRDKSLMSDALKIHDFFFAKALSKIRPGGVIMFLTSTGTLDKTNGKLRQFLTQNGGKIIGAVRLPNGFFAKNAGTDVASDLVIIQKVNEEADNTAFLEGFKYGTNKEWQPRKGQVEVDLTYNKYFADKPEQVIGEIKVGSNQWGAALEYKMPKSDLFGKVGAAVERALEGVDKDMLLKNAPKAVQKDHTPIYDKEGLRQGNITVKDGKVYEKSGDELVPAEMPTLNQTQKKHLAKKMLDPKRVVERVLKVREALRQVVDAEVKGVNDEELKPLLDNLNQVYDDFVKKVGTFHDKNITPFVMLDKADGNRIMTMENVRKVEGKDVIEKADILKKRVIFTYNKPTKADNADDALTIAYSETGALDLDRVGELLGVSADEAATRLKEEGKAFENPQTGLLEPHWEYLSGHVRRKLDAARAAAQNDAQFRKNVEALEKVQPKDVTLDQISIKFGNTWVDPEAMIDFLRQQYDLRTWASVSLRKNETLGVWELGLPMTSVKPFGETSLSQARFLEAVLNSKSLEVTAKDPVTEKYYVLERETEAQRLAAEKLHEAFARFLRTDEKWFEPSTKAFNYAMNDSVAMTLPDNILPLRAAGMSEDTIKKLHAEGREYQPKVIARGVLGGKSLCLAHCVGAGKTLEMQSIGMLGRHLGMFKKSMYVVPNHMLDQFCNEFLAAFPNANILKMSTEDVKPKNRRAFFAKVANGDWDAIVVKHSTYSKKLPMTKEWQENFLESEIMRLTDAKLAAKGDSQTVKKIEQMIKSAEERIKKLDNSEEKDNEIVPFEELGVDQLFVDEAHNFKGLPIVSGQARKTKGLAQGDSQRALDMEMKTTYIQSLHGGKRGVVFATGTPLSNAPVVEAYVMLRYLAPWALQEQGVKNFDDFVNTFGKIETVSEFNMDGKTTKDIQRVTAFVNIPEMMRLFKGTVDIVNSDQIKVKRPERKLEAVPVPMSEAQAAIMEMVAKESAIPPTKEERSKFLTLSGIAKRACISPRLIGVDDTGSKLVSCADKVKQIYDETKDKRGAQLIFTDIFNSSDSDGVLQYVSNLRGVEYTGKKWNLNEELKAMLVRAGIPEDQIGIIHDVDKAKGGDEGKDAAKESLFSKVRSGEVRVLIGSRPRMGEGTNVQERLAAIHLLHPGWKPSEDTQAIGRIIRPGNIFETGKIFYYLTQGNKNIGSYETKNHELISVKDKLINLVMHGDENIREIDLDESAAERDMLMGLATANQDLIKLIDVRRVLHKAELNVESVRFSAQSNRDNAERTKRVLEKTREDFENEEAGAKVWNEKNPDGQFVLTTNEGKKLDKVADMADFVRAEVSKQLMKDRYSRDEKLEIGNFNGVELRLANRFTDNKMFLAVPTLGYAREIEYSGFLGEFTTQSMTAFKSHIMNVVGPSIKEAHQLVLDDLAKRIVRLEQDADRFNKEWENEKQRLVSLRSEKARLERAVNPLIVEATTDRQWLSYGNWRIGKNPVSGAYEANRDGVKEWVKAPTVKELLPKIDEADFANPNTAALKTVPLNDLYGNRERVPTEQIKRENVDFMAPPSGEFDTEVAWQFEVIGPSGRETHRTTAKSLGGAMNNVRYRYFVGQSDRDLTARERSVSKDLTYRLLGVGQGKVKNGIIIANDADKRRVKKLILDSFERDGSLRRNGENPSREGADGVRRPVVGGERGNGAGANQNQNLVGGEPAGGRLGGNQQDNSDLSLRPTLTQGTLFMAPEEAEEETPSPEEEAKTFTFTNADTEFRLKAEGLNPPKHIVKSDDLVMRQADILLSNRDYMEKLAYAAAKRKNRPLADYETVALGIFAHQQKEALNEAKAQLDSLIETINADDVEYDIETLNELNEKVKELRKQYNELKRTFHYASIAKMQGASEQGRALRANRFMIDTDDYSYAGLRGQVQEILGEMPIPAAMDKEIGKLAEEFKDLDERQRRIAKERLQLFSAKIVADLKRGDKTRFMNEKSAGNELKRVMRGYQDALNQIQVHADEAGGTLIGLGDQLYPSWGKWLKAIGEYYCYLEPDITEEGVIAAIKKELEVYLEDGVDEESIRNVLTGFGQNFRQSRYESQRRMNDLKAQSLAKRQLDYMLENGKLPPQTGMVRDEPSADTRELRSQVQDLKKSIDEQEGGPRALQGALASAKKRVQNQIDDYERAIEKGERIDRSKRTIVEDAELREMKKRRDELKKQYDETFGKREMSAEDRIRAAEKLLSKVLENAMERYARAKAGDFTKKAKSGVTSSVIEELRKQIKATNDATRKLRKAALPFGTPEEIAKRNANKIKARQKAIELLQERFLTGDIRPNVKKAPPMPADMQKEYDALGEELKRGNAKLRQLRREAENLRSPTFVRKGAEFLEFINGAQKMAMASLDLTQVGNQTGAVTIAHPGVAAKSFAQSLGAFASEEKAEMLNNELLSDEFVKEAVDKKWLHWKAVGENTNVGDRVEIFDALDKGIKIGGKLVKFTDIPVYGTAIRNSDRLYASYINTVSANLYSQIIRDTAIFPAGATSFEKHMVADMINVLNGSGTIDKKKRSTYGKYLWAPGLVDSQLKRAVGYTIWHPLFAKGEEDGSGSAQERARLAVLGAKEFAKSHIGAVLLGMLITMLFGSDDDKYEVLREPTDWKDWIHKISRLFSPRMGNTSMDLTGGEGSIVRFLSKLITREKDSYKGRVEITDLTDEVAKFFRGRMNPLYGNIWSLWTHKDVVGEDFGWKEMGLSLLPISAKDAVKAVALNGLEDGNMISAALSALLVMTGYGKGTYRRDDYKIQSGKFKAAYKEWMDALTDPMLDYEDRQALAANIAKTNPLLKQGVAGPILGRVKAIDSLENLIARTEKALAISEARNGENAAARENLENAKVRLETMKAEALELIRKSR